MDEAEQRSRESLGSHIVATILVTCPVLAHGSRGSAAMAAGGWEIHKIQRKFCTVQVISKYMFVILQKINKS